MNGDDGRYGLRWRLRDAWRTVAFAARHQWLRYQGWGLMLMAAASLLVAAAGSPAVAWAVPVFAVPGGAMLWLHDLRLAVRGRTARNEDESENEDEAG